MIRRPVIIFGEWRVATTGDGRVWSPDRHLAGDGWRRGIKLEGLRLAGRSAEVAHPGGLHEIVGSSLVPLPMYTGLRGTVASLPGLALAVLRAVDTSRGVVIRLPGVIGLTAAASARALSRPVAVEVIGDVEDVLTATVGGFPGRVAGAVLARLTRWAVGQAGAVHYVTEHTLQGRYPSGPGARVVAFSDVHLSQEWLSAPPEARESADRPVLIAVGSQEQLYKGHDTLIRALPALRARHPGLRLGLVGAGRMQQHLRDLARELGVEGMVDFHGHIADSAALRRLVDGATIFCMPSRTEGLPRALVEAMSRARPALGSTRGGIPELLSPEQLVDGDDPQVWARAVSALLDDPSAQERLGRRNRAEAARYAAPDAQERAQEWQRVITELFA